MMIGRRENNQEKLHYRGNKLKFLCYKHGELLPMAAHTMIISFKESVSN